VGLRRTHGRHNGRSIRPEVLVEDVINALWRLGPVEVTTLPGWEKTIEFRLPPELAAA